MKRVVLFISIIVLISCCDNKHDKAMENLKEGYVWMDAGNVVHWNENCIRIYKDVLLLKSIREVSDKYCACVPASNIEIIENEAELPKYLSEKEQKSRYILFVNGKRKNVSISNIQKYGIYNYASSYPGAKIRMANIDRCEKCDVPLSDYDEAIQWNLRPCTVYDDLFLEYKLINYK